MGHGGGDGFGTLHRPGQENAFLLRGGCVESVQSGGESVAVQGDLQGFGKVWLSFPGMMPTERTIMSKISSTGVPSVSVM